MTRINCGIPPAELNKKMLFAEYREIKRIPNSIVNDKFNLDNIPDTFTLGKGNVKFFYNKLLYLKNRHLELLHECKNRGINITDYTETYLKAIELYPSLANDYQPTENDKLIIRNRILERLNK